MYTFSFALLQLLSSSLLRGLAMEMMRGLSVGPALALLAIAAWMAEALLDLFSPLALSRSVARVSA